MRLKLLVEEDSHGHKGKTRNRCHKKYHEDRSQHIATRITRGLVCLDVTTAVNIVYTANIVSLNSCLLISNAGLHVCETRHNSYN
jgi:hypothetical protein